MGIATRLAEKLIAGEEFARMSDHDRCELVEGRIVPMTPPGFDHGTVEANVCGELRSFVRKHKLGRIAVGEAGLYTRRGPDSVRGADVDLHLARPARAARRREELSRRPPQLIVEVLAPSTDMTEMEAKMGEYFAIGVKLVWLVDPESRSVSVYRSLTEVRKFSEAEELAGDEVLPGFVLRFATFFE